jgi:DNA modification methylase
MIFYCGTYAIPQILDYIKESGLNYYWIIAVKLKGSFARMWSKQISVKWKPLIWCIKGNTKFDTTEYTSDLIESTGSSKILHDWEQSVTDAHHVISRITLEGQVVLDLMMGSGTTGIAALELNRKFIGIENDADTFAIAKARISRMIDDNVDISNLSIQQSEKIKQIEINGDDIIEPSHIQDSDLVRGIRENNAPMTQIAQWEEKDLWEQYFSEWDPY